MKMKKATLLLSALAFAGGPALAGSADKPLVQAGQQTVYTDPANVTSHRYTQGTPMAQMPPTGWKNLSGKVQSFDRTSQTLQLRDKAGNLYLVPMDSQITINRKGKGVEFDQIHPGDTVRLHMTRSK
jgi:hypothetical protein